MEKTEEVRPSDSRIVVKGHDPLIKSLFSALQARQQGILFAGPEGVGKKRTAFALAQALLCRNPLFRGDADEEESRKGETRCDGPRLNGSRLDDSRNGATDRDLKALLPACGRCLSCRQTKKNEHSSVLLIEPESLQIKIKEAKAAAEFLSLQSEDPARIVIIDQADRLNPQAADSLLKLIEEPPKDSFFFLISSSAALPPTLLSRLWTVRFRPLTLSVMSELEPEAEEWALKAAQGSLSRLSRIQNQNDQRRFAFELLENILECDNPLVFPCPAPPAPAPSAKKAPLKKSGTKSATASRGGAARRGAAGRPLSIPSARSDPAAGAASLHPLKDKKNALFVIQCFQQILRDSRLFQLTKGRLSANRISADRISANRLSEARPAADRISKEAGSAARKAARRLVADSAAADDGGEARPVSDLRGAPSIAGGPGEARFARRITADAGSLIIHADKKELLKTLSRFFSKEAIDIMTDKALQMEKDLRRHADSLSLFESFAFLIHNLKRTVRRGGSFEK